MPEHRLREEPPLPATYRAEYPAHYRPLSRDDFVIHANDSRYAYPDHTPGTPYALARSAVTLTCSEALNAVGWFSHSEAVALFQERIEGKAPRTFEERFDEESRLRIQRGQQLESSARMSLLMYLGAPMAQSGLYTKLVAPGITLGGTPDDVGGSLENPAFTVEYKVHMHSTLVMCAYVRLMYLYTSSSVFVSSDMFYYICIYIGP